MNPALAFVAPSPVAATKQPLAPVRAQPEPVFQPMRSYELPRRRRPVLLAIAAAHVLVLWGLSQMQSVRHTVAKVTPVVMRIVAPTEPPKPPLTKPTPVAMPDMKVPTVTMIEPPLIAVATAPAPSPVVAALPPPPPPVAVQTAPTPPSQVMPPAAPPALKRIAASAVRYLREPRSTYPLMSRRLKESGVVHVRVVVDANGLPREVALAKSSGFARLDEQALQDIRTARFVPQTENGQPIEWEVITPMSYDLDR